MEISQADVVLCEFYFSDLKKSKNRPVSKEVIQKRYGTLSKQSFEKYHSLFCKYYSCEKADLW